MRRPAKRAPGRRAGWLGAWLAALLGAWPLQVACQELSPRAYWPTPVGTRLLVVGYAHADGDVLLDPTIPIYGVDSRLNTAIAGYVQTFDFLGRNANLVAELPYTWGSTRGLLGETMARRDLQGFGDPSVTMSVNLLGAPAMSREDFQALRAEPRPILGASLKLIAPWGDYDADRFINIGGNRWAARFQLGAIFPLHRQWLLEVDAGTWWFEADDDYPSGRREQDPIYAVETHLVHRIRPGLWASLDANWFTGGRQTVGGVQRDDLQQNVRVGGTLVFPFAARHALKVGYSAGLRTRSGSDFGQVLASWQVLIP